MFRNIVRNIFERARVIRGGIGMQITALSILTLSVIPTHAFDYNKSTAEYLDGSSAQVLTTASTYLYPVVLPTDVSQGYGVLHRGIDIRASYGSPVVSIDQGMVVEVREQSFGYGKHVRVSHGGTMSSLYAHLSKIEVKVGQKIVSGQKIGDIGSRGWSTGPQLHFVIMIGNNNVIPADFIG